MNKKIILVMLIFFISLCSIMNVSASDNDDLLTTSDCDIITAQNSDVKISEKDYSSNLKKASDDILSENSSETQNDNSGIIQDYGTYIGGNGNDKGKGVYIDDDGNIYLAMETNSNNLTTTPGAFQTTKNGIKDLYVTKLNSKGQLIYATYIGGNGTEMQKDLKVDSEGNVYIVGFTNSPNLPITNNAFQKNLTGIQNAFLVVLSPDGTNLVYSTYFGGSKVDRGWAIAIDDNGIAYVQGISNSQDLPVSDNAYQKTKDGINWSAGDPNDIDYQNSFDLFLSKFNVKSGDLEYATFFGGRGSDSTYGSLAVDENEVIYFAGSTTSLNFPVTENAFRKVHEVGATDSFIAALDIKNNNLLFSSYIGGNDTDDGEALYISDNGFLYYVGDTWSRDFPTTKGAYQTKFNGVGESISGGDIFIMKIDTSNWKLVYSTLLGGKYDEGVRALAVDEYENVYVVGMSQSEDYPITADAYQKVKKGPLFINKTSSTDYDFPTHDAVLSKISADGSKLLYSTYFGGSFGEFAMGISFINGGFVVQLRTYSNDLFVSDDAIQKEHANDTFNQSMLGRDLLYDVDSYLAIFKNPTKIKLSDISGKIGSIVGLTASLTDSMGNSKLSGKSINFFIDDELIGSAITDKNGIATFYYKLIKKVGEYKFSASFDEQIGYDDSESIANLTVKSASKLIGNKNIITYFTSKDKYQVRVIGDDGKAVGAGEIVKITMGSKTRMVKTDKNGWAKLAIDLKVGEYAVKVTYKNLKVSNKIIVKPILTAKNIDKKKAKKIKFSVKLVNSKGKVAKGKKITFKIKNKTYKVKTNKKGIAILVLKNLKVGKYTIKSIYDKSIIKNSIKIRK